MKSSMLLVLLACTACSDLSLGPADSRASIRPVSAASMPAPVFEEAVVGINGGLASRALSGDVDSSTRILANVLRLHGDNLNADQSRRLYFWLEIDAQNGSLSSVIELATYSESTIPFYCQRTKFWAAAARERLSEYEADLRDRSDGGDPSLVERTIQLRREAIAASLERTCEIPKAAG